MPFAPQIRKQIIQTLDQSIIPMLADREILQLLADAPFDFSLVESWPLRKAFLQEKKKDSTQLVWQWKNCTQHVVSLKGDVREIFESPLLAPIYEEILGVYTELAEIRLTKGGRKNYHLMILAYFRDLAQVFHELRRVTKGGCKVCFVIGDSAPYGVYVPVDRWLGELALEAGFKSYSFEKLRDRNTKWKNRKHTVPLHEGRLWILG